MYPPPFSGSASWELHDIAMSISYTSTMTATVNSGLSTTYGPFQRSAPKRIAISYQSKGYSQS
jgi:hypothetical protein